MVVQADPATIVAFVLAVVRAGAWVALVPPFGGRIIPMQCKVGLAAALALPVTPVLAAQNPPIDSAGLIMATITQVAVGLTLGFLTMLLFSAVQAAGELMDLFGGFTVAQAYDPLSNNQAAVLGRLYHLVAIVLLFAINGHLLLVRGFLESYELIGVRLPPIDDLSGIMVGALITFGKAAIEIAAPVLVALFLAEVALGLLARAAPQMNVFALGFPVKIIMTLSIAVITMPLLSTAVGSLVDEAVRTSVDSLQLIADR
jgi:flagellar biosynthesis protein FliR